MADEAPGVAEGVQDVPVPGQGAGPRPVLALIQVEPGLVPDADRHVEAHAALVHPDAPGPGATGPSAGGREPLEPGGGLLVHLVDLDVAEQPDQRLDDRRPQARHAEGEALHHQDEPVPVHDQPGKAVGFAPDQAAERRRLAQAARAQSQRPLEPATEEGGVERLVGPGEDAAAEGGAGIVEAATDEAAGRVDDRDLGARLDVADLGDVALEDPGMATRRVVPALEPKRRPAPDFDRAGRLHAYFLRRTTTMMIGCRERSRTCQGLKPKNHWTNSNPPASSTRALSSWGKTIRDR